MKRVALLCVIVLVAVFSLTVGCNTTESISEMAHSVGFVQAVDSKDGYATVYVPDDRDAKVLLLADPQLDPTQKYSIVGSYNELTIVFLNKFLNATNPDLVIIAGDVVMSALLNNWKYFCQIADIFETKQIPWTFVFGNHDCENEYVSESVDTTSTLLQMTKPKFIDTVRENYNYCMIYSGDCEDGFGNHIVNVRNTKGELLNTFCNLDCVYEDDSYSHVITEAQTEFYSAAILSLSEREKRTIPSIVVTHVALPEAFIGYREAKANEGNSRYYYGELVEGDYAKYVNDTDFFDTILRLGSTKAVFFGHHHSNDASIEYKGIRLSFIPHSGMSHEYRVNHSKDYQMVRWPDDTVFDFTNVDLYGDHRGGIMVTIRQNATYTFTPTYASDVIHDYAEWAINYDAVVQKIAQDRGEQYVIRGRK